MIELNDWEPIPRKDVSLLFLTTVPRAIFSPIQLQKGIFLISKNLPELFEINYNFMPYDYGPYDADVYADIKQLEKEELAKIFFISSPSHNSYVATHLGFKYTQNYEISNRAKNYIKEVVEWILPLTMSRIIGAIVRQYPEYSANMIFRN